MRNKLLRRVILLLILCTITTIINISYCGAVSDATINQQINDWANTATREELRNFDNFLEGIRNQNNPNLVINNTEKTIVRERFGWESLGIFIGFSILGYLFIRHGMSTWDTIREFLGELVQHSLEALRIHVTNKANTTIMQNPNITPIIQQYLQQHRH